MKFKNFLTTTVVVFTFLILFSVSANAQDVKDSINYKSGSKNYPGIQPGEVFYTIISDHSYYNIETEKFVLTLSKDTITILRKNFEQIRWKTKRLGNGLKAYDPQGNVLKGFRPVFVQESELKEAGLLK